MIINFTLKEMESHKLLQVDLYIIRITVGATLGRRVSAGKYGNRGDSYT